MATEPASRAVTICNEHDAGGRDDVAHSRSDYANGGSVNGPVRRWNHLPKGNSLRGRRVLYLHQPISPTLSATANVSKAKSKPVTTTEVAPIRHEVQAGETLYSIATSHHTTVEALERDNGSLMTIKPGMVLIIHPN